MAARRKAKATPVVIAPQPPPEDLGPSRRGKPRFSMTCMRNVETWRHLCRRPEIVIPAFQRPYVWNDQQVLDLLDSLADGYPIGVMQTWQFRGHDPIPVSMGGVNLGMTQGDGSFLVDGQQRTTSLVHAFLTDRFFYDCAEQKFLVDVEPHPSRYPLSFAMSNRKGTLRSAQWFSIASRKHQHEAEIVFDLLSQPLVEFSCYHTWPIERVLEVFRRLNTMGTPMDLATLQAGIARVTQITAPTTTKEATL